jgi:hypothetical protein
VIIYNQKRKGDKTMTRAEIEKRIEEVGGLLFMVMMTDHYTAEDWELDRKYRAEIARLENELNHMK